MIQVFQKQGDPGSLRGVCEDATNRLRVVEFLSKTDISFKNPVMDPAAGMLKEIAKRKAAVDQDARKWKSKAEIEEERCIAYYEKEREHEEMQGAKKRQRIGPAPPPDHFDGNESVEPISDHDKDANRKALTGHSNKSVFPHENQPDTGTEEKASEIDCRISESSAVKNEKQDASLASRTTPGNDEEAPVNSKEDQVHEQIRKHIRVWKSEIEQLPEEERKRSKGRAMVKTFEQTKTWLKPLEKLLRKRKLKKTILNALKDIFDAAEERDYMKASRLYLERLAIGNAPWPMGATMVGIHARAAREKIGEDKIAHVMNDEQTRKYIQGVKRLLTVAERNFPAP